MITCDFCNEEIEFLWQTITVPAVGPELAPDGPQFPPFPGTRIELHAECVEPWSKKATKAKGTRPPQTTTGGTPA